MLRQVNANFLSANVEQVRIEDAAEKIIDGSMFHDVPGVVQTHEDFETVSFFEKQMRAIVFLFQ